MISYVLWLCHHLTGTTATLKDYQHKSVLLEVISLDDSSSVSRYTCYCFSFNNNNLSMRFCTMMWIEIGGTTYKLGGFVIVASDLFPEFAHIVDIVVTDKLKCFFICERYDTLLFNKHYHSYEVEKYVPNELITIQQSDLIDFHVHTFHSVSNTKFMSQIPYCLIYNLHMTCCTYIIEMQM